MACDECKGEIAELREEMEEIEGRLAEKLLELKQNTRLERDRLSKALTWAMHICTLYIRDNFIPDKRGNSMRDELMGEMRKFRDLPRGDL